MRSHNNFCTTISTRTLEKFGLKKTRNLSKGYLLVKIKKIITINEYHVDEIFVLFHQISKCYKNLSHMNVMIYASITKGKSVHIIFDNISFFFLYRRGSTKPQYTEVVVLFFLFT